MAEFITFELAGQTVNPPKDWEENSVSVQLNFDRDNQNVTQTVNITNLEWVREENDIINKWIQDGISGAGPGIFEGIPLKIKIDDGTGIFEWNGYCDLTEPQEISVNIRSTSAIKEIDSPDFINETIDGIDFSYLFKVTGEIVQNDFTFVPYILNSIPDYPQAMLGLLSIYVISQEIKNAINQLSELAVEMANPFEATAIVRAVLRVAYLIILIATLITLIKDTVQLVIQPVKYHQGMFLLEQLQKGLAHFGYTFKSPILESAPWNKLFILPEKQTVPKNISDNRLLGFTQANNSNNQEGFFKGTVGDLLRIAKTLINGKIVFKPNNEIHLVRMDQNTSVPQYQIPNIRQDYFTYNTDEFRSNYLISFLTDVVDKNTIQQFKGTNFQVITKPNTVVNQKMVLMKGYQRVDIPLALAKRKEELTVPEKIIKELLDVFSAIVNGLISAVNALINVYNEVVKVLNKIIDALDFVGIDVGFDIPTIPPIPPVNLAVLIENRIGMLMLEIDNFTVPKIMLLDKNANPKFTKLDPNNITTLSASTLWHSFYYIQSFVPTQDRPNGNQYRKFTIENAPFNRSQLVQIKENNKCFSASNEEAEIDYLEWFPRKQTANLNVRISELYTNNLHQTFLEPDGK